MKEADYAFTKADKVHRLLSALICIGILGYEISSGMVSVWYRHAAAPVLATALVWFPDALGGTLPWRTAPRDFRVVGWVTLILMGAVVAIT